jgi:hypothetical protein
MAEENVQEAKTLLQKILGEDYDEEGMKNLIDHVITALEPDSVVDIIGGIGSIGPKIYKKYGFTDDGKIYQIKNKLIEFKFRNNANSGGARKRRTPATTIKQRKSSRSQLPLRRRRTNKK